MKHCLALAAALAALSFGSMADAAVPHAARPAHVKAVVAKAAAPETAQGSSCCAGGNCCANGACCAMAGCSQSGGACCAPDQGACTAACGCLTMTCCGK